MRSVNKVILIGNLTRDPEMRQTPNGQAVVTFGLATNREWMTKDNEKHSSTEFHELVAWARLAEICQQYLKKGKLIYVEGYLKTRSWDTPEGVKKFKTEIIVQDMIMLEKRPKDGEIPSFSTEEYEEEEKETESVPKETLEEHKKESPKKDAKITSESSESNEEKSEKKEQGIKADEGKPGIEEDLGL